MSRRKVFLGLSLLGSVAVIVYLAFTWSVPWYRINEASFGAIREGMTRAEVETLLGAPPGNYTWRDNRLDLMVCSQALVVPEGAAAWHGDEYGQYEVIWVLFDKQGNVEKKERIVMFRVRSRFFERLRRGVGL